MEGFKFEMGQEVFIEVEGEVSKHKIRGFYQRGADKIYVIVTYGRESLVKEENVYCSLEEAKALAVGGFEDQIKEIQNKIMKINELNNSMELGEERSPQQIAQDQEEENNKALAEGEHMAQQEADDQEAQDNADDEAEHNAKMQADCEAEAQAEAEAQDENIH